MATITIADYNDNSPVFIVGDYVEFPVVEEREAPLLVGVLVAMDIDVGLHGDVEYSIEDFGKMATVIHPLVRTI